MSSETLPSIVIRPLAGDAGVLNAPDPALSRRFHFWRGASGRRYPCSVFAADRVPNYERAIALFVNDRAGGRTVAAAAAGLSPEAPLPDSDEVHVHLARDGAAFATAFRDLSALLVPAPVRQAYPLPLQPRAAIHSG